MNTTFKGQVDIYIYIYIIRTIGSNHGKGILTKLSYGLSAMKERYNQLVYSSNVLEVLSSVSRAFQDLCMEVVSKSHTHLFNSHFEFISRPNHYSFKLKNSSINRFSFIQLYIICLSTFSRACDKHKPHYFTQQETKFNV